MEYISTLKDHDYCQEAGLLGRLIQITVFLDAQIG